MFPKVGASWKPEIEKQLLQFPSGKYDDAVDVFSLLGRGMEHIVPARIKRQAKMQDDSMGWMGVFAMFSIIGYMLKAVSMGGFV